MNTLLLDKNNLIFVSDSTETDSNAALECAAGQGECTLMYLNGSGF